MTIFNRMSDVKENEPKSVENIVNAGGSCRLLFGTEEVAIAITANQTIKSGFQNKAEALGLDYDRRLSFRDEEGNIFTGDEALIAGRTYLAAVTHDSKGV